VSPLGDLLVVGLGNPGTRYAGTRHNVGADAVTLLAHREGMRLRPDTKVSASTGNVRLDSTRVHLAVPTTYMNDSGRAMSQLLRRYGPLDWDRIVVVHDELDLEPGVLKVKSGGGLAGHNGLRDIATHLGSQDFARIRIGVGKPPSGSHGATWVLSKVSGGDRSVLSESVERAAVAVQTIATEGVATAMQSFNAR
jgi:PTH1 family peptidyl-tRNA hydrolase